MSTRNISWSKAAGA